MWKLLLTLLLLCGLEAPTFAQQNDPGCSPPGSTQLISCRQLGMGNAGYPVGATPQASSATGTTAGATATLSGAAGRFTYFCGYSVSPGSATAAITITITISGIQGGSHVLSIGAPITAAGTTGAPVIFFLPYCIPSSAVNTSISVAASALGTGGVNQAVNVWGYLQ